LNKAAQGAAADQALQRIGRASNGSSSFSVFPRVSRLLRCMLAGKKTPTMTAYPSDQAGRQQLADELMAKGLKPTQTKQHFDRDKINKMIEAMLDGSFDWSKSSLQPVILGPQGEILGGHHRVIAAHLAGIDLTAVPGPRPQVYKLPINYRSVGQWLDVLPDVA
jgi:hypothetical protein